MPQSVSTTEAGDLLLLLKVAFSDPKSWPFCHKPGRGEAAACKRLCKAGYLNQVRGYYHLSVEGCAKVRAMARSLYQPPAKLRLLHGGVK